MVDRFVEGKRLIEVKVEKTRFIREKEVDEMIEHHTSELALWNSRKALFR